MRLFGLLYDLGLHLLALATLPKGVRQWKKYKKLLFHKLGGGFPRIEKQARKLVWIHAVSLGETKAVIPLVKRLKKENPTLLILLSTTTQTGHEEGKKNLSCADFHLFLPFDVSYIIKPLVRRVSPDLVILVETDFWYHFQKTAKECGAQLILINGKLSVRSFLRYKKLPFLSRALFHPFDHFCLQGEVYRERFEKLGVPQEKMSIMGNMKCEGVELLSDEEVLRWRESLALTPRDQVLVLGSTHAPEEKIWMGALKRLWEEFPTLKVLLVPRHPERFAEVASLLEEAGIRYNRWGEKRAFDQVSLLLVDAMGVLRNCYQIGDFAFVGGSFTEKVGGHNIMEPCFYGKAVLFGPHMQGQPDFLELVRSFSAGIQIQVEEIVPVVKKLMQEPHWKEGLGRNGRRLVGVSLGALDKTYAKIQEAIVSK